METMRWGGGVGLAAPLPDTRPGAAKAGRPRPDGRGRRVLVVAVAVAVTVNAAAAWAYWRLDGAGAGVALAGSAVELKLQGRSDDGRPLYPGGTADLTVTIANQHPFGVRIVAIRPGDGAVTADSAHRDAGCRETGVAVAAAELPVSWEIPKNTIGVFTVPDGLRMTNDSDTACQGAVFAVPVQAGGVSNAS